MKKLLFVLAFLTAIPAFATTVTYRDKSTLISLTPISTATQSTSDSMDLGPYSSGSVQCVWAGVTGTQPVFALQTSNNGANWDAMEDASETTVGATGSNTWYIMPIVSRYSRIAVTTASSAGTLTCTSVLQK